MFVGRSDTENGVKKMSMNNTLSHFLGLILGVERSP